MESDVLHMVSPYQKRTPAGAPSKIVVSDQKSSIRISQTQGKEFGNLPRVLDYEA